MSDLGNSMETGSFMCKDPDPQRMWGYSITQYVLNIEYDKSGRIVRQSQAIR